MTKKAPAGSKVPPALKRYHIAHPHAKNAHKSYGPNAGHSSTKSKGK
jgi:hypothetical protein